MQSPDLQRIEHIKDYYKRKAGIKQFLNISVIVF